MDKGAAAKEEITKKILAIFPGSFVDGKVIRINANENSVQIKVTLTTSKEVVEPEAPTPAADSNYNDEVPFTFDGMNPPKIDSIPQPTEEERENVKTLLGALGL